MIAVYIALAVVVLFVLWYIVTGNNLIARRNRMEQCRSSICVLLKQRNDMLPNLVAAAKAYMGHENQTLTRITELRAKAVDAADEQQQIAAGNAVSSLLPQLQIAVENYPELKADKQFVSLHYSIEEMEQQLQAIRRTYNAAVTDYNNGIQMFPSSWVAARKGFVAGQLIEIPEAEKQNVNVGELFKQ